LKKLLPSIEEVVHEEVTPFFFKNLFLGKLFPFSGEVAPLFPKKVDPYENMVRKLPPFFGEVAPLFRKKVDL